MRKCRGMALLMVLVALAVMMSVAAGLSVRYHTLMNETSQLLDSFQARWYVKASDVMAVKIIKQDISDSGGSVNLAQYWAQEGRTFPVEGGTIGGFVSDSQTCFNVNAINTKISGEDNFRNGKEDYVPYLRQVFHDLLIRLEIPENDADIITDSLADFIDPNQDLVSSNGAENPWYAGQKYPYRIPDGPIYDISEIRLVRGMTPEFYRRIRPFVCALPDSRFVININTMRQLNMPLLAALFLDSSVSEDEAWNMLAERPADGYPAGADFVYSDQAMSRESDYTKVMLKEIIGVTSSYFDVHSVITYGNVTSRYSTKIQKVNGKMVAVSSAPEEEQ